MTTSEKEAFLDIAAMHNEPLDPELQACLTDGPLGPMLAHPLVHVVGFVVPGLCNRQLRWKSGKLEQHLQDEDWHGYVFTHERPYRTTALIDARLYAGDWHKLGDLPASVWTDTENIHQHLDDWARIMRESDGRDWMSEEEFEVLHELPDEITIYRGECNDGEVSWTLKPEVAAFFAKRETHSGTGVITHGTVFKRDVFCYLGRRNEYEIIVPDRSKVKFVRDWEVKRPS